MTKKTAVAVVDKQAAPVVAIAELQNASPSTVLSALSFELGRLASNISDLGDIDLQLELSSGSASLKFRAYSKRQSLM
jgi:hypothetical protein